jgi:DNA-binding response OmpR family regulator
MVQAASALRILVVEDCPDTSDEFRLLLELWGHDVLVAPDAETAMTLAWAFRPQVVLLDLGRPAVKGLDVARRLRRAPPDAAPALVAATGPDTRAVRLRAWEAGCSHFFAEPLDQGALRAVLSVPLPRPRARRSERVT